MYYWTLQDQKLIIRVVNKKLSVNFTLLDFQMMAAYNCVHLRYSNFTKKNFFNYFFIVLTTARGTIEHRIRRLRKYEQMGLFILEGDQVKHTPLFIRFINEYEKELKKKINEVKKRAKERGYEL